MWKVHAMRVDICLSSASSSSAVCRSLLVSFSEGSRKSCTTCVSAAGAPATSFGTNIDVHRFRNRVSTAASTYSRYALFASGFTKSVFGPRFREEGSLIPYSSQLTSIGDITVPQSDERPSNSGARRCCQRVKIGCSKQEVIVWEALARRERSAVQMCLIHTGLIG